MQIDVKQFGKVAVLMGGMSAERQISLLSGQGVFDALIRLGVDAHKIDVKADIFDVLRSGQFDRAFIILHGRDGEDGKIQAMLEWLNIPYTGSGVLASALGMDKLRAKMIVEAAGFKTPKYKLVTADFQLESAKELKLPLAVKPVHEGSSLGISKIKQFEDLAKAITGAQKYHDDVMIEEWIDGGEYTVPIISDEPLPSIKISTPKREFYDYDAKYVENTTLYECPNDLSEAEESLLASKSLAIYKAIGCRHWGRVDFMRDHQGEFYFIEINTVPGMTPTSLPIKSARTVGLSYDDIIVKVLSCTLD